MKRLDVKFELDDIAPDGHIGLIALATDYVVVVKSKSSSAACWRLESS